MYPLSRRYCLGPFSPPKTCIVLQQHLWFLLAKLQRGFTGHAFILSLPTKDLWVLVFDKIHEQQWMTLSTFIGHTASLSAVGQAPSPLLSPRGWFSCLWFHNNYITCNAACDFTATSSSIGVATMNTLSSTVAWSRYWGTEATYIDVRLTKTRGWPRHEADQDTRLTKMWGWPRHEADQDVRLTKTRGRPRHEADQDTRLTKTWGWPRHEADQDTRLTKMWGWPRHEADQDTRLTKTRGWPRYEADQEWKCQKQAATHDAYSLQSS